METLAIVAAAKLDEAEALDPMRLPRVSRSQEDGTYPLSPYDAVIVIVLLNVQRQAIVGAPGLFVNIGEVLVNHGNTIPLRATPNNPQ